MAHGRSRQYFDKSRHRSSPGDSLRISTDASSGVGARPGPRTLPEASLHSHTTHGAPLQGSDQVLADRERAELVGRTRSGRMAVRLSLGPRTWIQTQASTDTQRYSAQSRSVRENVH